LGAGVHRFRSAIRFYRALEQSKGHRDVASQSGKFSVRTVKHPIFWVGDLETSAAWFERVFGQPTLTTAQVMADAPKRDGYTIDYGTFHLVQDTFIESIDPARLVLGGKTSFPLRGIPPVAVPSLGHLSWYVDGTVELFATLQERGLRCQNQVGELTTKIASGGSRGYALFYALREEAGLAYQFVECPPSRENARRTGDARLEPGWKLTPPPGDDELGVELCSHHTIVTSQPDRMLGLMVGILGGQVIHQRENDLIGTQSTFVALGDGVFECAVPSSKGLLLAGALNPEPYDTYHSMTFLVRDLERAEAHLWKHGIRIARRSDDAIATDPATSYGVPWSFTTSLTQGDPRGAAANAQKEEASDAL
jgi:catechol 2,3-dioxygenase-like lactoylglutathione lyase family enzyme